MTNYYYIIKALIVIAISYLLYVQLTDVNTVHHIHTVMETTKDSKYLLFLWLCIALMPINWWLESKKWQILMSPYVIITRWQSFKSVLAGVAAGIVTPARLGEYAGRLVLNDPDLKSQVISATLLGSLAQNLCNIIVGAGFSYYFLKSLIGVTYLNGLTFLIIVSFQVILMIYIYYNLPKVASILKKFFKLSYIDKWQSQIQSLDQYSIRLLHKVLAISAIRYLVYFMQYILILKFLGVELETKIYFQNIGSIYLIQTLIPLPAFVSVLARGELAILVWTSAGVDKVTALTATFGLWMINLIVPAILGLIIIYSTNFKKYFSKK